MCKVVAIDKIFTGSTDTGSTDTGSTDTMVRIKSVAKTVEDGDDCVACKNTAMLLISADPS